MKNQGQEGKTNQIGWEVTVTFESLGFGRLCQENSVIGLPKTKKCRKGMGISLHNGMHEAGPGQVMYKYLCIIGFFY